MSSNGENHSRDDANDKLQNILNLTQKLSLSKSTTSDGSAIPPLSSGSTKKTEEITPNTGSIWLTTDESAAENFNGHFYSDPKPFLRLVILEESRSTFHFTDGHSFTVFYDKEMYNECLDIVLQKAAAAPVFTIQSKFRQSQMPDNFLQSSFTTCMKSPSFWENGTEIVIEGHYNATVLHNLLQLLPNKIDGITMVSFSVDGKFSIDSIISNFDITPLKKLCFNCRVTSYTDFYANLSTLKINLEELFLLTTGFVSNQSQFSRIIDRLTLSVRDVELPRITILSTQKIDDQICNWLERCGFQHAGRTRYPSGMDNYEHYETFNQQSKPYATIAFQARD